MGDDCPSAGAKLVNSVILTLLARGAMILITVLGLPMAGWMMQRSVSSFDDISKKVDTIRDQSFETGSTVKLIQQSQESQTRLIADHELRVRTLEQFNRYFPRVPQP